MNSAAERYHSLDALRASALLLGVLLHAALAYVPGPDFGWAVRDASTNIGFGIFVLVVHSFRLEVFFLLAGFFARLMYLRLDAGAFARNRLRRILVPFVLGWLLVFPLLAFGWIWAQMGTEPAAIVPALQTGYAQTLRNLGQLFGPSDVDSGFSLTHLWFLYYLLLVYAVFLTVRGVLARFDVAANWLRGRADAAVRMLFGRVWGLPLLAVATGFVLCGMQRWGVDTPDKTFRLHGAALALYGGVFALGWLLHRQTELLMSVRRHWRAYLMIAIVAVLPVLALVGQESPTAAPALRVGYQFAYALLMWAGILACLAVFLRFRERESALWRYLADSSYWVYIVHLPLVVALQVALSRVSLGAGAKFGLAVLGATTISLVTYHLLVRSTPVGLLLNGRRVPFSLRRW